MRRSWKSRKNAGWSLALAALVSFGLAPKAHAQFLGGYAGHGAGYGMGLGGYGMMGLGGYGMMGLGGYGLGGYGYGLGGYGLGMRGLGWGYPGYGYGWGWGGFGVGAASPLWGYGVPAGYEFINPAYFYPGYVGLNGLGFYNPMFGTGLTPLGTRSYLYETRMLGRVPRPSSRYAPPTRYAPPAYRSW